MVDASQEHLECTAVVADPMPLVRVGLVTAMNLAGVGVAERAGGVVDALEAARRQRARLVVTGAVDDDDVEVLVRRASSTDAAVIALVAHLDRAALVALLGAGVVGVALRSVTPEDLAAMARSVLVGERSVAPALLALLVGLDGHGPVAAGALRRDGASPLTAKEQQVLARLASGETNAAIAEALFISPATVKSHLASIYAKLEVRTRQEATSRAVALGLLH